MSATIKLFAKEEKELFQARSCSLSGSQRSHSADCLSFLCGEKTQVTDDLIGADQKILDSWIKIRFLKKVVTATRSGFKFRFGVVDVSTRDSMLGLWFSL